ncbi:hypothetical protein HDU77_001365, partial [Chytriomyces hyalinus]
MPLEIFDLFASFVGSVLSCSCAMLSAYYKYISQAMFDFGYLLTLQKSSKFVQFTCWPCVLLQQSSLFGLLKMFPIPASHMHALQTYSNILSKHGGYVSIDSTGMTVLGNLPENVEVEIGCATPSPATDKFFGTLYNAKKNIWQLSLGFDYFAGCESDPALLDMTAKWLVKLCIHELRFMSYSSIPAEIRGMLHLMPKLSSLDLRNLGD